MEHFETKLKEEHVSPVDKCFFSMFLMKSSATPTAILYHYVSWLLLRL